MFSKLYRTIPHTASPQNGTESASRDPDYKDTGILKGDGPPKFLKNMHFAKNHKKAGRKCRTTIPRPWAHLPRLSQPFKVQGGLVQDTNDWPNCSLQAGKWAHAHVAKGPRLHPRPRLQLQSQLRLRGSQRCPGPHKGSRVEASLSANLRPEWLLSTWGWCSTVLFI